jgi:tetratricopeptide (TPR) repeat protein
MRYDDFELLVMQRGTEGYPTRVISASAGEAQGILSFKSASDDIQHALTRIETEETDEDLFINLGRTLFQKLFSDEIENIYRASLGYARAQGKGLRIRLRLEPPELSAIPWEYLYDELNDLFLGISPETPITRYIQVPEPPRPITIHSTLKVLTVISNPVNLAECSLPELDADKEKQVLSQALEEWEREGLVQLEFLDHAVASEMREKLRRYQPHIFHFIGHGAFKEDKAYLVIEDDDHRLRLITDRTFREFFLGNNFTKLVVLNSCQSATTASQPASDSSEASSSSAKTLSRAVGRPSPIVGLAPNLVRRGLPAVVAMQYSIYDDTAIRFSREFYRTLALGFPVDTAISEARRGIYMDCGVERRDWGIPVLFMRAPDGVILKLTKPIARPLRLESIPGSGNFIGRKKELDEYQKRLDSQNIVVIGGTAGVGKTMLGARIVSQWEPQRRAFWHTFHKGLNDNLESVIWALGGFLAASGDSTLQRFLDLNIEKLKDEGYQLSEAINLLIYSLEQGSYLLCFDDFQVTDEDEKINSLFGIFNDRLQHTKAVVMTRRSPRFADALGLDYEPLTGLNEADAKALLNRDGIHLNEELFAKLYEQTLGNPKLLELFIAWMENRTRRSDEVSEFIDQAFGEKVGDYLISNVYETMSVEEQKLLKAISIFRAPVDKEAIGEVLIEERMENVDQLLDTLVHKYAVQESDYGEKYLHSLLGEFCHDRLRADASFRARLHQNAGRYYYGEEDYLEAAHHYFEAREYQKSAEIIIDNLEQLIYAGQSSAIIGQLRKLSPQLLDTEAWISVCMAIGDVCMVVGEYDSVIESYQIVLETNPYLPDPRKIADAKRMIGLSYERKGQYDQALKHYGEGIQVLGEDASVEMARIYGGLSSIYTNQGKYEEAIESARQGLQIVEGTGYEKETADCYDALGRIYVQKGEYDTAIEHYEKALEARNGDRLGLARSHIKLGIAHKYRGEYDKALEYYTDSLRTSEEIGDIFHIAASHGELGFVQDVKSNYDEAIGHYNKALALFQRLGNEPFVAITHNNLGETYRSKGEHKQAIKHLDMALKTYTDFEDKEGLSDVYRLLSEINLCQGNIEQAQEYSQEALELAVEIGSKPYEGSARRTLGKIQTAMKNLNGAREYLAQSLDIFKELGDNGEAAYTLSDVAHFEHDVGNIERAREACAEALEIAEELGIGKIIEQMADLKHKLA